MIAAFLYPTLLAAAPRLAPPELQDLVPHRLSSISFTAKVLMGNQAELRKISEDFGKAYRFDHAQIDMETPFKVRVTSIVQNESIIEIGNGNRVEYRIPRAGVHTVQNIVNQPGRRLTFLDYGLVSKGFETFFDSRFVRVDRATHDDVFDLTYANKEAKDTSRFRIWINPSRQMVDRKEWYGQGGQLRATFYYKNPSEYDHIWVPTMLVVRNAEDRLAGEMKFEKIKVNPYLKPSLFGI